MQHTRAASKAKRTLLTLRRQALTLTPDRRGAKVTFIPLESQLTLAHDGLGYLYHESTADGLMQSDFATSQAVAKMIMQGAAVQPTLLGGLAVSAPFPHFSRRLYTSVVENPHHGPHMERPCFGGTLATLWIVCRTPV